jgi:hypothetical protein
MEDISTIYSNNYGMAFYWKKSYTITDKVQLIFKETGFYYTFSELRTFNRLIKDSLKKNNCCAACALKKECHKFLLKTPCEAIELAVTGQELSAIKDLVEGTLFKIELTDFIKGVGRN